MVTPSPRPAAAWRVIAVEAIADDSLRVRFVDGTDGKVDMSAFLRSSRIAGTVFEELRNPVVFRRATLVLGAVQWPNGAELAPDAIYDAIRAHGIATIA